LNNWINDIIDESIRVKEKLKNEKTTIESVGNLVFDCLNDGGTIYLFGNGGSAADSQHIAAELVGRYQIKRDGLPAVALTTNTSILTAISNDFGYDHVFERQVESFVKSKDIVMGISTSGNSSNVVNGILAAKKIGAKTVVLTGVKDSKLAKIADIVLKVPSQNTQRIQESHILIGHIICDIVESKLQNNESKSSNV